MKKLKNKIAAILISIFFILSMTASITLIPNANAHTPTWQITTYAFIHVAPSPVGVGQAVSIYVWLFNTYADEVLTNNYRFHNFKVTITAPDGTQTTQTFDEVTDPTSSAFFFFTPDHVGTYNITFNYPGQNVNDYPHLATSAYINDTYLASSASTTLTVQQEPIPAAITSYPLPTDYWTRPIYGENTDWWAISSNWFGTGSPQLGNGNFGKIAYVPDGIGPQIAHVMWTKPLQAGGVVGGNDYSTPGVGFFEGSAYNNRFSNPIIMNGKLYFTEPVAFPGGNTGATDCVDLRTGQILWSRTDIPALSFGYIYNLWDPNQHGVFPPILFTSNFARAFDADTGNPLFNVTGVPTGKASMGPNGEILRYTFYNNGTTANPNYYLCEWNSTNMWNGEGFPTGTGYSPAIDTTTTTTSTNVTTTTWVNGIATNTIATVTTSTTAVQASMGRRYDNINPQTQNQSIPWRNNMTSTPTILAAYCGDILLCWNGSLFTLPGISAQGIQGGPYTYFAVNLNASRGTIGSVLWWNTLNAPSGNLTVVPNAVDPVNRIFLEEYRETVNWVGYNLDTGQKLWGPTGPQTAINGFDYYGNQFSGHMLAECAYGNFYVVGFAGICYCYNLATGELKWTYGNGGAGNSTNSGFAINYGNYPTMMAAISNGILYMETTEHTVTDPIYKGALARAVNATDGTEIWTLSDYTGGGKSMSSYAIADGYATFFNGYDNQVYCIGRGPSSTTVQAPQTAIPAATAVVIQGTVTDISAGTKQNQQAADFPHGVPCASDASMSDWMGFIYQQKPQPSNFTGVLVSLDAIDPNGNYIHIGDATTTQTGLYTYTWTPPSVPGNYLVTAMFAGTNSYWGSTDQTGMNVQNTPATSSPYPVVNLPPTEMYITIAAVAIIVAMAIVGTVIVLVLRKRP